MTSVVMNNELKGIELYFDIKPEKEVRASLKANGYHWRGVKMCWYAKQTENAIAEANKYIDDNKIVNQVETVTETQKCNKKNIISLYDRVQFVVGNADTSKYNYNFVGSNYSGLSVKETAKEIRSHLKKQFPEVKFSVTSDYNRIDVTIKTSPYCWEKLEYSSELECSDYRNFEKEHNKELLSIMDYCNKLVESYNYDDSDTMSDYFNTHFYSHVSIDYNYIQTEQTEAIKKDIENFRNMLVEAKKLEEERKEVEYQEYLKKQEQDKITYELRQQEEAKQIENIYNSVEVKELEENEQYFVIGSQFANLNKNCTLDEYKEEVTKGDYILENVNITRELHFDSEEALNNFSNLLLNDFTFIEGTGGSYTNDNRINSMIDYDNMTREEQNTVEWNLKGIAVYYNNELQFVIDAQGYSYARYVGLVENVKIEKSLNSNQFLDAEQLEKLKSKADTLTDMSTDIIINNDLGKEWNNEKWNEYKELIKAEFKNKEFRLTKSIIQQLDEDMEQLRIAMYKLLKEVDGIQEQFKNAELQQGQKLTMLYISDWGGMVTSRVIFDNVEYTSYAQYNNAVKVTFTPQGKRKLYYNHWYDTLLVYDGWLELPEDVLNTIETNDNFITKKSKYLSCDRGQYDAILEHFENKGIKPIINTYRPIF